MFYISVLTVYIDWLHFYHRRALQRVTGAYSERVLAVCRCRSGDG